MTEIYIATTRLLSIIIRHESHYSQPPPIRPAWSRYFRRRRHKYAGGETVKCMPIVI